MPIGLQQGVALNTMKTVPIAGACNRKRALCATMKGAHSLTTYLPHVLTPLIHSTPTHTH